MNSLVSIYLWKEWREQQKSLGVLALVLLCGALCIAYVVPRDVVSDPVVAPWIVGLSVLTTLMTMGADLIPRERQGGTLGFLERVPASLGLAFRGKLAFFGFVLLAALLYGSMLAVGASLLRTGHLPDGASSLGANELEALLAIVTLSLWVFAVSAWMPSSALTVPATLILLAVLASPVALATAGDPAYRPAQLEQILFFALCFAGAPLSAWGSFILGSRRGASRGRAACIGLSITALCFSPTWVWAGVRYAEVRDAPFEIRSARIGPEARFAFVNLGRQRTHSFTPESESRDDRITATIVDLERGTWRLAGEMDNSYVSDEKWFFRRMSLLELDGCDRFDLYPDRDRSAKIALDGRTALPCAADSPEPARPRGLEPSDFGLTAPPRAYRISWAGLGHAIFFRDAEGNEVESFRDLTSGQVVDRATIFPELQDDEWCDVRVRSGRWLARKQNNRSPKASWMWFDPESGQTGELASVAADDRLGPSLDDGRFVLVADGRAFLLDPESGERESLEVRPARELELLLIGLGNPWSAPLRVNLPSVVSVSANRWSGLALLDLQARTLRLASMESGHHIAVVACDGAKVITVEDEQRIVRRDLERDEFEVLFSVDAIE